MTPKELEILNQLNIRKVDLARVHFCKDNKVKYRKHLTAGIVLSAILSVIGVAYNISWLTHMAVGANTLTSLIWIWE